MTMKAPSRRQLLLGGVAIGALATTGAGYLASAGPVDYFRAMLRYRLPDANISEGTIHAFANDALSKRNADFLPKLRVLSAGVRVAGYEGLTSLMQENPAFEQFDREFLTRFLIGSNFFQVPDPARDEIVYAGVLPACGNPFALFEPPQAA